ncbi:MAG TPA: M23 family metallopeptidase [Ramlibacter sp.]|nr:M23 family metallopeptidase [Ramlibacter sp.]
MGGKLLSRAARALEHHPKHVTAFIAALMLGGGGAAFAVASLGPDPASLPVRQVLEAVQPLPVQQQMQELDLHSLQLFRSDVTRASDNAEALLARLGIDDPQAAAYLRKDAAFRAHLLGRAGRAVTAQASASHALEKFSGRWAPDDDGTFKRLVVERTPEAGFVSRVETGPLVAATRMGSATVRSSLFSAADEARIPDAVIAQVIQIFSGDIDFHRALHSGDRLSVVYEALEADGEAMRTGRVLSAEFVNKGQRHQAVWFQEPGRKGAYYTLDGKSLETSYLASPMEFSRVTSSFAMRFHPILHRWKAHLGTDYGAATGTPVRSVGEGVVVFAGEQNGFGKVVIVKHNSTDETLYAHLSRIGVRPGQSVSQGHSIGAVGMTGWATGPHLHFEFRVNGVHRNPQEIARRNSAVTLSAEARPQFDRIAYSMRSQLAATARIVASAE